MDDDVETESLLDDEILSLLGGWRSWVGVSPGRMSLSAGRGGDVGGVRRMSGVTA